jgi:hypothetical protein
VASCWRLVAGEGGCATDGTTGARETTTVAGDVIDTVAGVVEAAGVTICGLLIPPLPGITGHPALIMSDSKSATAGGG